MIAYHDGAVVASWKNGIGRRPEDAAGQRVKYAITVDGATWTAPALLFENMTTPELPAALFAGPFASLGGRLYASATPGVLSQGDAQGAQFCLWPDGLDPRDAGPPGQAQPAGVLMLRRVLPTLGPAFWASPAGTPAGFGPASAAAGVLTLADVDATTRADVAALSVPGMPQPPCEDAATGGTLKCEACIGGCQSYRSLPVALNIANERAHWPLAGGGDAIVYRASALQALYASVRAAPGGTWTDVALSDIPNDTSNINAGLLPSGRAFLLSNLVPGAREPLTIATTAPGDDLAFVRARTIVTCTDTGSPLSTCVGRNTTDRGVAYPQGLTVVPPAPAALVGFWAVLSNNKEDILVARAPFEAVDN